jgi:HK97 family phage major capsid protein
LQRAKGALQYLASGSASAFDAQPADHLIDMVMALKPGHRQGAAWVMNANTIAQIRKVKDAVGDYLWQNSVIEGQPDRLLGYPVVEASDMPDVAAGNYPVAFGNFKNGYLIAERQSTRILRDPYSNKPYVNFYATKRVGGQVLDSDAIKLLKIAAS